MTINETGKIFKQVFFSYPAMFNDRTDIDGTILAWHKLMCNKPFDIIMQSTIEVCKISKYPPSISDIFNYAKNNYTNFFKKKISNTKF